MARWYTRRSSIIRAVSYCSGCAPVGCEKKKKNIEEEKRKMSISKLKLCNFHKSTRERERAKDKMFIKFSWHQRHRCQHHLSGANPFQSQITHDTYNSSRATKFGRSVAPAFSPTRTKFSKFNKRTAINPGLTPFTKSTYSSQILPLSTSSPT